MSGVNDYNANKIPAIFGGTPVRDSILPYGQQWIDQQDIDAVLDVISSDFITQGPRIEAFEQAVADYVGVKYAVAFSSGTAALHGACFAAGIGPGDEVITTPITFAASANCVRYQGGTVVFADINPDTYNIDPKDITKKITSKTKAIIPVDFTGQPVEMDRIKKIAKEHGLVTIHDAAHSFGARYKHKRIGKLADMTMFSFHPVKHITTGEGGMIVTDSKEYYEKLLRFRSHGITRDPQQLLHDHAPWYYEMQELGYNYRMTDIQAALGLSQLQKVDRFIELRKKWANVYNSLLSKIDEVVIPYQVPDAESSWHLYVIQLKPSKLKASRRQIFEALRAENIGVNVHYIPVYYHPYYQRLGYQKGLCPVAEQWYENVITLPLFPKMTEQDIKDVVHAVKKVIAYYRK